MLLKPTGFTSPFWGKVQEIRDAVLDFRKSGKPIYAYLEYGGDRDYYLATAADKIFLMPSSPLDLTGVATYELFLRGTLDKIGVVPGSAPRRRLQDRGRTRSPRRATPPRTGRWTSRSTATCTSRSSRGIADGRKKTEADVRALIDDGPFLPEDALRAGLVDDVAYEDQVRREAARAASARRRHRRRRLRPRQRASLGLNRGPRIAVIYAAGAITSGKSGYDP